MTPAERYHRDLREIGCIACKMLGLGETPPQIHHLFDPHERSDWLVVPLCAGHHQSRGDVLGFHPGGERRFRDLYGFGEKEMLAQTLKEYAK